MPLNVDAERLRRGYATVRELLLRERTSGHYWVGELSTSALSTATAVMALLQVRRHAPSPAVASAGLHDALIAAGLTWLLTHQHPDGGWGDTVQSFSNISTTMLCHATLVAGAENNHFASPGVATPESATAIARAAQYIDRAGGVPALIARYGKDKTFSVPILTHCALAGLVDWRDITPLPFELACIPARFYKTVRLPVVSYALPALIAIGQVRHHFAPTRNPLTRVLRKLARQRSLAVLESIQPPNGGFLEATPLTSFVTMSLAAMGLVEHPVVQKGVEFIVNSVRPDGSWPIDTNLSTWVTTLAVNALGDDLPEESRLPILNWLLDQQFQEVHPYTNANPGGWAWTPLPGGVPDADDTAGAILALMQLSRESKAPSPSPAVATAGTTAGQNAPRELDVRVRSAVAAGVRWLLDLQNRDGGFPTFCRGWGQLPFDRSSADITAHALRAFAAHAGDWLFCEDDCDELDMPASVADGLAGIHRGLRYLNGAAGTAGYWLPLWFGNQHAPDDINPAYGTAKVLAAYLDCRMLDREPARRGLQWLRANQNSDGGWGAGAGTPSSVEETALATEALLRDGHAAEQVVRGIEWLLDRIAAVDESPWTAQRTVEPAGGGGTEADGVRLASLTYGARTITDPAPIGFYFAKLWYFERLYPLIFAVSCLRRAVAELAPATAERASAAATEM